MLTEIFVCSLYGAALSEPMPVHGFEWVTDLSILTSDFISKYDENGSIGYILEVDVDIPWEIHDATSDYPLLPEHLVINETMISPKSSAMRRRRGYPAKFSSKKLSPNLYPKTCYVAHIRSLKFALRHGVIITRVRRAISFNQSPWIKGYVELNTKKRREEIDEYEKNLFKLLVIKFSSLHE